MKTVLFSAFAVISIFASGFALPLEQAIAFTIATTFLTLMLFKKEA